LKLQDELASTENQILARTRFNEAVKPQQSHQNIPKLIFAGMFGLKEKYFKLL
jgi:hypothetical protein